MVTNLPMFDLFTMLGAKKSKSTKKCSPRKVAVKAHRSVSDMRKKGKMIPAMCRKSPKKSRKSKSKSKKSKKARKSKSKKRSMKK